MKEMEAAPSFDRPKLIQGVCEWARGIWHREEVGIDLRTAGEAS